MLFRQAETTKAEPKKAAPVAALPIDCRVIYRWPIGPVVSSDSPFMPLPMPSGKAIIEKFCAEKLVSLREIKSQRRTAELVALRHELAFLLHLKTGKSLPEIGRMLDRDHTSILNAIRMHKLRMAGKVMPYANRSKTAQIKRAIAHQAAAGMAHIEIAQYHGLSRSQVSNVLRAMAVQS